MNDEKTKINNKEDVSTEVATLSMSPKDIQERLIQEIINSPDRADLEKHLDLFNFSQAKNNALRAIKLNKLLEKVEDQILERFDKKPEQMSNKDLLDFMQAISNQVERAKKETQEQQVTNAAPIQITNSEVTIQPGLSKESKEKVTDFINEVLKQLRKNEEINAEEPIIVENDESKVD